MPGLADKAGLLSVLGGAFQTFGGHELYPTIQDKAAKVSFEIIMRHPFNDGNKRTGLGVLGAILTAHGENFLPDPDDLYDTIVGVGSGAIDYQAFVDKVRGWCE